MIIELRALLNGLYTPLGLPVGGEQKRLSTYGAQELKKLKKFFNFFNFSNS